MRKNIILLSAIIAVLLLVSVQTVCLAEEDPEKMAIVLARGMKRVQGALLRSSVSDHYIGQSFVEEVLSGDQRGRDLLDLLNQYAWSFKVMPDKRGGKWGVLLVCKRDESQALFESANCQRNPGSSRRDEVFSSCEFSSDIYVVCPR